MVNWLQLMYIMMGWGNVIICQSFSHSYCSALPIKSPQSRWDIVLFSVYACITKVAQETRWQVAHRLKRAPNMHICYSEDYSDSEEEQVALKWRRPAIKSGKVHTADTTVLKQIVYDPRGKPAAYNDLPSHYSFMCTLPSSKLRNSRRKT